VAVSTERLQVRRVVVEPVSVNVVHVQLADVDWLEVAVLAVILLVDCVRVDRFIVGFLVDSLALVPAAQRGGVFVSQFDFGKATD
jgi:hypothetical protein